MATERLFHGERVSYCRLAIAKAHGIHCGLDAFMQSTRGLDSDPDIAVTNRKSCHRSDHGKPCFSGFAILFASVADGGAGR